MTFIRLVVFGFLFLSVVYIAISWYSRSVRKERLEKRWDEDNPTSADIDAKTAYVNDGMDKYNNGLRPKLVLLVYVIPTIAVAVILIATNGN
ncbi:MAG: hypothetical protein ACRBCL_06295 [Maritimibacter sp.]